MVSGELSPEIHRMFHEKVSRISYRPVSIKDILNNIWRYTDVALDLAFYAYFSGDRDAAKKVLEINKIIDENIAQFIIHTSLGYSHSRKRADASLLAFFYGASMDIIVDSLKDIAYMLLIGLEPKLTYEQLISYSDGEIVEKVVLPEEMKLIELTDKYPLDVLLYEYGGEWKIAPKPTDVLRKGSTLYVRGYKEIIRRLLMEYNANTNALDELPQPELEPLAKGIVEVKDYSRLMVDLAHYVLMEANPALIDEVEDLEIHIDWKHLEVMNALKSSANKIDADTFLGIASILKELEDIADASNTISHIPSVLKELPEEYRELFSKIFESIGEKLATVNVPREMSLDRISSYLRKYGGTILAVKTSEGWIAYPLAKNPLLRPGDKIIIAYPYEFSEEVEFLLSTLQKG